MSANQYKFVVKMVNVYEGRHKELHEYLKSYLMTKKGIDHFEALFAAVDKGEKPVVHQTNSASDARHVMMSLHMHGAASEIHEN